MKHFAKNPILFLLVDYVSLQAQDVTIITSIAAYYFFLTLLNAITFINELGLTLWKHFH